MESSSFWYHFEIVGTPRGAFDGADDGCVGSSSVFLPKFRNPREIVAPVFAFETVLEDAFTAAAFFSSTSLFFASFAAIAASLFSSAAFCFSANAACLDSASCFAFSAKATFFSSAFFFLCSAAALRAAFCLATTSSVFTGGSFLTTGCFFAAGLGFTCSFVDSSALAPNRFEKISLTGSAGSSAIAIGLVFFLGAGGFTFGFTGAGGNGAFATGFGASATGAFSRTIVLASGGLGASTTLFTTGGVGEGFSSTPMKSSRACPVMGLKTTFCALFRI
mmetsp:Transcript_21501/g.31832  ORF Transcript_21501/g.31832 Transcript_21501/m.31832 type:complete len:277 (+) Transcript_21501:303-1133(+)